jgi:hypothetical protein
MIALCLWHWRGKTSQWQHHYPKSVYWDKRVHRATLLFEVRLSLSGHSTCKRFSWNKFSEMSYYNGVPFLAVICARRCFAFIPFTNYNKFHTDISICIYTTKNHNMFFRYLILWEALFFLNNMGSGMNIFSNIIQTHWHYMTQTHNIILLLIFQFPIFLEYNS